jgi:MoxR-like ATPase
MLKGRSFANTEDVREVAAPVLRHRVITNFNAEADGVTPDVIVRRLTGLVPADASAWPLPAGRD